MSDNIAPTIVPIRGLEGIELGAEQGRQIIKESLGLGIRVEGTSLSTSSTLTACNVVTIFIINVDTIESLITNNVDKAC